MPEIRIKDTMTAAIITTLLGVSPQRPARMRVQCGNTNTMIPVTKLGDNLSEKEQHAAAAKIFCRYNDISKGKLLQAETHVPNQFVFVIEANNHESPCLQTANIAS